MVLQKRLDYGFNGYRVPPMPRSTRSARKRGVNWRRVEGSPMCSFDLLATVAGKLLLEGESSCSLEKDSVDREKGNEDRTMQEKPGNNQGSCERNFFLSKLVSQAPVFSNFSYDSLSPKSVITTSDSSDKFAPVEQLVNAGSKLEPGSVDRKGDAGVSGCKVFSSCKLGTGVAKPRKHEVKVSSDTKVWDRKPCSTFVCSDNSVKMLTLSKDHIPCGSFPASRGNVKLGNRDDDENSSVCTQPSTANKAFEPALPRIGDQRIGKLLASEYCEVNPKSNYEEHRNAGEVLATKPALGNKKNNLKSERSLRDYPFKKRKLYDCSSVSNSNSDRAISNDGNCSSHTKGYNGDASNYTPPTAQKTAGTSTSAAGGCAFFRTGDSQVKLRIKSFRVPELFVEIPETSTVGSLKRTVMEAVTTILGGGLHVGVLFQGKKIRDDDKTLLQTGISRDDKPDTLGFSLEPIPPKASSLEPIPHKASSLEPIPHKASPPPFPEERPYLLSCDTPQPLRRYTPSPRSMVHDVVQQRPADTLRDSSPGTNLINFIESDHDSAPSPPDTSLDKSAAEDSRALVPVPAVNMAEPHDVVPVRKPKRSEAAQRRIRRPFSVSEVEALVQAVEKLGTGRWRDVKLRAFDNAKHRTYVDLKDKWKTLVHTARISPQQRRGEPVPQELLDRVLIAHAYWSQQQAKQQMKQQAETCLLL
ncbi:PREDICTED: telomere repeat-binding protein 5-like isoform X2 [Ipomoea nil]|uniref:telomere repeat-binding protein 5-like isoform X2 n=1 Tax=Ipomoea nil TaxID=35883 RepID=UPI000900B8A7|nr:PREDICTED: telomere repeat-binding protein 5-like isoform X2 [Ipomoea nil]